MTTETEKKTVSEFIPICPFNIRVRKEPGYVEPGELKMVNRVSDQVKVDHETMTVIPVMEQVDLQAEIQTYKDQCGLEFFKQQLLQGKVRPEDSHDDGSHSVDATVFPETIHEAHAQSKGISETIGKIAKDCGVKDGKALSSEELIDLLAGVIAERQKVSETAPVSIDAPKE